MSLKKNEKESVFLRTRNTTGGEESSISTVTTVVQHLFRYGETDCQGGTTRLIKFVSALSVTSLVAKLSDPGWYLLPKINPG